MKSFISGALLCFVCTATVLAQNISQSNQFSRVNTYTLFTEYSNTSSPILLGSARQRKLADFGGGYTRHVVRFWGSDLGYHVEVRPVLFESDPVENVVISDIFFVPPITTTEATSNICRPGSSTATFPGTTPGSPPIVVTTTITCGRQWTFGEAFSPIGFKYSMRTRHPLQPYILGTLGYMYTSRPVPVATAEAFNFYLNLGVGIELYRSQANKRSVSVECLYNHFSNRDTAASNPGTDNIVYKVSYNFGR
jgi:hypothetical protein